jgi:hypothetical protein
VAYSGGECSRRDGSQLEIVSLGAWNRALRWARASGIASPSRIEALANPPNPP